MNYKIVLVATFVALAAAAIFLLNSHDAKPLIEVLKVGSYAEYDVKTSTVNYTYRWEVMSISENESGWFAAIKETVLFGESIREIASTLDMQNGNIITGNETVCFVVSSRTIDRCKSAAKLKVIGKATSEFAGKTREYIEIKPQSTTAQAASYYDAETGILLRSSLGLKGERLDVLKSTNIF